MMKSKSLVEAALLIALAVVFTRFFSIKLTIAGVEGVRVGIGVLPIVLAGLRGGVWQGARVGILADVIGYILSPGGPYMPHFTLTTALNGVLPPLIVGNKKKLDAKKIMFSVTLTLLVTGLLIVPYFLNILFGIPYAVIFWPRLISFILNSLIMNFVLLALHKRLDIFSVSRVIA